MNFDYNAIASQLKVELARHQALASAAAAFEQLGSLAAHADALESRRTELFAAVDKHTSLLDELKAGVESAKNEAVYLAQTAKAEVAKLAGEAEDAVKSRYEKLDAECHEIVAAARKDAHAFMEAALSEEKSVRAAIAAAQNELVGLASAVVGKKTELEAATTALESVKAQASKIVG